MKSIKDTRLAQLLGGKGAYITLAAAVLAAGGAGAAAYSKAVKAAEESYDLSISQIDIPDAAEAEKKQTDILKEINKTDSSSSSKADSAPSLDKKIQPNVMPVNGEILEPFSFGELVKSKTLGIWKTHDGVDIAAEAGTPVKAMNRGEVTAVEEDPLWGYTVTIDHGSGIMGYYYNLSSAVAVKEGDMVESGQTIGAVGDTAEIEAAVGSHLHFGLKKNGEWTDPISYIDPMSNK